jgi:inhibitor of growth protein 3
LELALGETSGHSRESTSGGKTNAAPTAGNAKGNGRGRAGGSNKRPLDPDGFSLESSDEDAKNWKAPPKKVPKGTVATNQHVAPDGDGDADMDQDASPYCICHGPSYGEMIGCDNDNCEIEWVSLSARSSSLRIMLMIQFHISCLGLSRPPEGEWTCPQCTEKLGKHPSKKRASRAKARK